MTNDGLMDLSMMTSYFIPNIVLLTNFDFGFYIEKVRVRNPSDLIQDKLRKSMQGRVWQAVT